MFDNSNPKGQGGGFFGYSETFGGYPGGQAEYMRVPYANFTPFKIPEGSEVDDDKLVLLSDAMGTAYWSVENAGRHIKELKGLMEKTGKGSSTDTSTLS